MGVFEKLLKYSFAVVTLLIFIIGVILLGLGIHEMVSDADTVGENTDINLGQGEALFLTIVGGTVTLVSFLGCCGAFTENRCLLNIYFILVLVSFLLVLVAVIYTYVQNEEEMVESLGKLYDDDRQEVEKIFNCRSKSQCMQNYRRVLEENIPTLRRLAIGLLVILFLSMTISCVIRKSSIENYTV